MKKVLLVALVAAAGMSASAQMMDSFSYTKTKSKTMWYARVGVSVDNITLGDYGKDNSASESGEYWSWEESMTGCKRAGLTVDFGFQKPISNFGLYWGMELGIGTRGGGFKEAYEESENYPGEDPEFESGWDKSYGTTWAVKYSPITLGYKYAITDQIKLDAHIGAYLSYDFAGKKMKFSDSEGNAFDDVDFDDLPNLDYKPADVGMTLGLGVWFNRFNLDFSWQRGFVPMFETYGYDLNGNDTEYKFYSSNFQIRLGVAF